MVEDGEAHDAEEVGAAEASDAVVRGEAPVWDARPAYAEAEEAEEVEDYRPAADDVEDEDEDEVEVEAAILAVEAVAPPSDDNEQEPGLQEDPAETEDEGDRAVQRNGRRRRRRRRRTSAAAGAWEEAAPFEAAPEPEPVSVPATVEPLPRSRLEPVAREIVYTVPDRPQASNDERKIAMFCDLENIALGVRDSETKKFDFNLILKRLLEKGKIIVKRAYADWERYSEYKRPFHEAAIELIDIPQKYYSGKNSADIKLVVDAMDLCYSKEHLDTFVVVSGDSDFSPLVSKLKENNKYVIGVGVKNSSSSLLIDNCDEFIYYEDVWRAEQYTPRLDNLSKKETEVFGLMIDAMLALMRENKDVLWGSMVKQTMQRKRPSFNESYYGYSTFSDLLEDAERKSLIRLKRDQRSGNYVVTGFARER